MEIDSKKYRELAEKIYDLDAEVYDKLGSNLGRIFQGNKDKCINDMIAVMENRKQGFLVRSELALLGNMARTLPSGVRGEVMRKYDGILKEVMDLPTSFGDGDILDARMSQLNALNVKERFAEDDHLIICIGRSYGCGGTEIGFKLADELKMNFYDVNVMNEVIHRKDGTANGSKMNAIARFIRDFRMYHGITRRDDEFFEASKLIVEKSKEEDFICVGRFAEAVLSNNHIPHISIFITAPTKARINRLMVINPTLTEKHARTAVHKEDKRHARLYKRYTGRPWGKASNYDLCFNSACYGIQGTVDMIKGILNRNRE